LLLLTSLFLYTLLLLLTSLFLYTLLLLFTSFCMSCYCPFLSLCTPCYKYPPLSVSVHPVVTAHLSLHPVVISTFNVTYLALCPNTLYHAHLLSLHTLPFPEHKTHHTVELNTELISFFNISTTRNAITINISTLNIATVTFKHHFEERCSFVHTRSEEFGRQFGCFRSRVIARR
jgi:hypothetical protein